MNYTLLHENMNSTVSVSKGVFVFPNGFKKSKSNKKKSDQPLFETLFKKEPWYITYRKNWTIIEDEIKNLHNKTYSMLLSDIVNYLKSFNSDHEVTMPGIIPSATLLTGVNQPDHVSQFVSLIEKLREEVTPHIAMVNSQDGTTLKNLVENVVWQLMYGHESLDTSEEDMENTIQQKRKKLKKNQCNMKVLKQWYQDSNMSSPKKNETVPEKPLVVIIPDFESFNSVVLQDFVMIVSSYVSSVPLVLVFGVATSVSALHKSFPYHVSSKLLIKVFHSHSSPVYMNQVLEDVFLTHKSPFHLSGKAFELLTDVFLFYDFSVTGLIQSMKYCMMEHYYADNVKSLCCERDELDKAISKLSTEDLESVRQLMSFRPFVEAQDCQTKIRLFEDDDYFKNVLYKEITKLQDHLYAFYVCVRLLSVFVKDLPRNVLGKTVREIYTKCAVEYVGDTEAFKESMLLLNFTSQVHLIQRIKAAVKVVNSALQSYSPTKPLRSTPSKNNVGVKLTEEMGETFVKSIKLHLTMFLRQIENASTEATSVCMDVDEEEENVPGNRYKLKEKLLKATKADKIQSEFELVRDRVVSYIGETLSRGLRPARERVFHEILVFSDVAGVRKHIVGAPRGALHTALSNPVHYLQCECCHLPSTESVSSTLPDVCLAYKLHRECGKHINLYDWMQAFASVLRPDAEDEERQQDNVIQVRFTRAVSELQFLGFIKSSKRKTDHVMRLTW